jgi:hypothetical protein
MVVPLESLPDNARVWVYQANRTLTATEEEWLAESLARFCDLWTAHGKSLRAAYKVAYHRFVVLAVDEQAHGASGCSIDASVHALAGMQQALGIDFFTRTQLAFWVDGQVVFQPLQQIGALIRAGVVTADMLYFNTIPADLGEWRRAWPQRVEHSWMKRHLSVGAVPS